MNFHVPFSLYRYVKVKGETVERHDEELKCANVESKGKNWTLVRREKIPKRKRQGLVYTPTKESATATCLPCIDGKGRNHGNNQSGSVLWSRQNTNLPQAHCQSDAIRLEFKSASATVWSSIGDQPAVQNGS